MTIPEAMPNAMPSRGRRPRALARLALSLGAAAMLCACSSLPPAQSAEVGAQRLAYWRVGQGTGPAVVLQSGLGDSHDTWSGLIDELKPRHTVFAYDRPGYGSSPRAALPRDPCAVARELRETLRIAGIQPPYLLVGHSLGGLYQHAFARLYPEEVAGLLLLEPTHPRHWESMQQEAPLLAGVVRGMRGTLFSAAMRDEFDAQAGCLAHLPPLGSRPPPARLFGRSDWPLPEQGAFAAMVERLWDDWRGLAGVKTVERLPGSDHYLHHMHTRAVARVIDAMAGAGCQRIASAGLPACGSRQAP